MNLKTWSQRVTNYPKMRAEPDVDVRPTHAVGSRGAALNILIKSLNYAPELTGIGKYTGEMAAWLAARGHEVDVVAITRSGLCFPSTGVGGCAVKC
ncbi:MAG: hypothetical protein WAV22_14135 [Porticoccaceae bacterium]